MTCDRRTILRTGLLAGGAIGAGLGLGGCDSGLLRVPSDAPRLVPLRSRCPLPAPYSRELPVVPVRRPDAGGRLTLTQRTASAEILPGMSTEIYGYDGIFPGPTIEARRGSPVHLAVRNDLAVPTSTHLHGGVTPPDSDGGPLDLIVPPGFDAAVLDEAMSAGHSAMGSHHHGRHGVPWRLHESSRTYRYPMVQDSALLWYHDHRMDFTGPQVWRGLAGMFLIRDDTEDGLELPRDDRELLLCLTDRAFDEDGQLLYPARDPELLRTPGVEDTFMNGVIGDVMLVNGAPCPRTTVARGRYRLRLLNACNARQLSLRLNPGAGPDLPLTLIGSDLGLLRAPVEVETIDLAPAERVDLLVDFSVLPAGTRVEMRNADPGGLERILAFDVAGGVETVPPAPAVLKEDFVTLDPAEAVAERTFDFRLAGDHLWTINGEPYDPWGSSASPRSGTVERWTFTSDFDHPVHVHLGHFQVVFDRNGETGPSKRGWKDTVRVTPYGVVEVLVTFPRFRGLYMLHCHNLEHEDMAMMANFTVV
ncbi:FtsP/CotA-like multicopper oxidase with cupredoxin domain [Brevibacterium sanguinis]|uniref:FtsP/CotA-like multicopper oxidase with cupredoxin domain n=2 Tax=Brevibacterium TaxID=1696 RepID=A0A366IND9_9MICO|nr:MULTISPECIES: multicopper oxidase domain-containing protein [Brevibacterium]RBP67160.1 FtsP/CotA-like multicopper oxidase with cupredoxin domain [Brevibacterium sanguinis]RBP73685.1 FtsP/CotA-like multicopper oxidase with cupredoxin domain [Brevibacterium celere]